MMLQRGTVECTAWLAVFAKKYFYAQDSLEVIYVQGFIIKLKVQNLERYQVSEVYLIHNNVS
jgi:hypothetical protein